MDFDPVLLARIQFAFTISFHIIFPAFTIGLASYLAMLEFLWLRTRKPVYKNLYKFWLKIFAISFGMGVVSGIVLSYQFGTNWSGFSHLVGNVLGPLLAYEVLTAFFLEASFLGIMLFGWERVGDRLHFASTCIVAVGTLLSAFWILAANSWMHTPAGYEIKDGLYYAQDWLKIVFNPSFSYRFVHMIVAAYLTTAFTVIGVGAWHLLRRSHEEPARVMFSMGLWFVLLFAPAQLFIGDLHGLNVRDTQPAKLAAMEGHWETGGNVPLLLFAWPDEEAEENHFEFGIPNAASLIITHSMDGEITGLKDFASEDRPPVAIVFWSFRIMVGLGTLMIFIALAGVALRFRGKVYTTPWFLKLAVISIPSGFIAVLAGWFVTEVGRQPYIVYGLIRTIEAASPVPGSSIAVSLTLFVVTYGIVFTAGTYYIVKLVRRGPISDEPAEADLTSRQPHIFPGSASKREA